SRLRSHDRGPHRRDRLVRVQPGSVGAPRRFGGPLPPRARRRSTHPDARTRRGRAGGEQRFRGRPAAEPPRRGRDLCQRGTARPGGARGGVPMIPEVARGARVVLRRLSRARAAALPLLVACPAAAQTVVQPGFNVFTVDQDVEIGRQSALQVEKQIPTLSDPAIQSYVASLGARLAARAPGPRFAYHFKVVNLSDVNAFALPGGYVYVHRGLLEQVRTEGELAGVLAHEIAHVAL